MGMTSNEPFVGVKLPAPRPRAKYIPTPPHIRAIIDAAIGEVRVQLMTLAMTGMRVDELANLRPCDVDLASGWITVRYDLEFSPKTSQARRTPIHPELHSALATICVSQRERFFQGVPTARGYVPPKVSDRLLLLYMQGLASRLGIPIKRENAGIVIHSFRDFMEISCVNSGVPQFVIDAWMGHAGGRTQGQTYYGLTAEVSKDWMSKVKFF